MSSPPTSSGSKEARPPPPTWPTPWGPYENPNLLLSDVIGQLATALLAEGDDWAGRALSRFAKNVRYMGVPVTDGKKAAEVMDGVGKGIASKIDIIIQHKFWKRRDGTRVLPTGKVAEVPEDELVFPRGASHLAPLTGTATSRAERAARRAGGGVPMPEEDAQELPAPKRGKRGKAASAEEGDAGKAPTRKKQKAKKEDVKEE
ncbi:hypothetical protein DFJ74DRAFT_647366 [Hyaloraphidium curvatum]|nr:hypothetical protein DFJ74DRAFT_647366 [Hyaloraphidium curvatum]